MINPYKNAVRESIKQVRSQLTTVFQEQTSKQICSRIRGLEEYRKAKRLALYHATQGEVDLSSIWGSAPLQGKFCFFPALQNNNLLFLPATPATPFKKNKLGILEPDVDFSLAIDLDELDVMLVPLVAFDAVCTRIGMGAGYYDRTLKNKPQCKLFGVAYQFQRVDFIKAQDWDVPLDGVITQAAIYLRNEGYSN